MSVVRSLRSQVGITQAELARRAGTSQPTVAAYESGQKSPTLRTLAQLAHAVDCDIVPVVVPRMTREDRRSLAVHEAVAQRLVDDPFQLIRRARVTLARMDEANPGVGVLLREWRRLFREPIDRLVAVLRDPSPYARELRQVTPFAGVLSARERSAVYRRFRRDEGVA